MVPKWFLIPFLMFCGWVIGYSAYTSTKAFIENERNEAYTRGWRDATIYYEQRIEEIEERIGKAELNIMESNQFVREAFLRNIVARFLQRVKNDERRETRVESYIDEGSESRNLVEDETAGNRIIGRGGDSRTISVEEPVGSVEGEDVD